MELIRSRIGGENIDQTFVLCHILLQMLQITDVEAMQ